MNLWRSLSDLVMFGLIGFALYLLFVVVRWPLERRRRARREAEEAARAPSMSDILEQRVAGNGRIEPRV